MTLKGIAIVAGVLTVCAAVSFTVHAQPPSPPPPGFPDYIHILDNAYNRRDLVTFAAPFASDVKVYLDGTLVASDRDALLSLIKQEFTQELRISPVSWAQGEQLIVFEIVTGCVPDHPDPHFVYHGCPTMRAVRYDLGAANKITTMYVLQARAWNIH